jgi:hypothetical protein
MPDLIEQSWQSFHKQLFSGIEIGEVQLNEMRKAFFGGAVTVLSIADRIGEDSVSEEEGCRILEALHIEVLEFAQSLPDNVPGMTDEEWQTRH